MGGSTFDSIAQELLKQQKIMEEMEAENRWLREELANLRTGRGIFLEIEGKRIPLHVVMDSPTQVLPLTTQPAQPARPEPATSRTQIEEVPAPAAKATQRLEHTTMPLPTQDEDERAPFLEEMMIDEFSAALTSPTAIWQGPPSPKEASKKPSQVDEDELAALRRDLMGSFLLE